MATSGSLNSSAYNGRYVQFSWTASQSVANNQTTISWTLKGAGKITESGVTMYKAGGFKVVIDDDTVYSKSTDYRIELWEGTSIASGTPFAEGMRPALVWGCSRYPSSTRSAKNWARSILGPV